MQTMPLMGQGTWHMGERVTDRTDEAAALRLGIDLGMTLIDTAEMYGDGGAERVVGEAIAGYPRDALYIVSKVYPYNAGGARLMAHCDASLARLGIDTLDLYLLHWPGSIPLAETVDGMQRLVRAGKIRRWGVSNFDTEAMQTLLAVPGGEQCAANQVLYHLGSRGIEYSLLPLLLREGIAPMAYCPLAQRGRLRRGLLESPAVQEVARHNGITPVQVLLGFVRTRWPQMAAIPKASTPEHVRQNAAMASMPLPDADMALLDAAFPAPDHKTPLDIE